MASKSESKTTSPGTALAQQPQGNNAVAVPSFMAGADSGKDSYDASDLIIPRVALLQGISPPVMQGLAENGQFWHTINEVALGDGLRVTPLLHRKQWTLWRPLHAGGGVIARASDGAHWDADFDVEVAPYKEMPKKLVRYAAKKGDVVSREIGLGAWGSADPENSDSGPAATLSHIFLFRALDFLDLGPFIVFLQKSSERVAKQLLTKIHTDRAPIYGQVLEMGHVTESNKAGQEYNQYTFRKDGWVMDEPTFREFEREHQLYKTTSFRTNDEDAQDEGGPGDNGGGAGSGTDDKEDKY